MPSLENFDDKVKINGIPYPKDSLNYQFSDGRVSVYPVGFPERIIQQGKGIGIFSDWTLKGVSYMNVGSLIIDLDIFLFNNNSEFQDKTSFQNLEMICLMKGILEQLKILNLHQEEITDKDFNEINT